MKEEIQKTQETTKVVAQGETSEGKKIVTISKGTKKETRLDHVVPSWMTSEE